MSESVELLFFDTFAHENSEELNLDLVQFPKPVYVTEVRIIPLGARVHADFPGGVRLGATNPSQFQIEFFVNDLGKPGASTFESLGGFEYNQNGCINLECTPNDALRKIPTDGLVLRGWYTTITLAVYGTLTVNIAEQIMPPVVTPSLPAQPNTIADVQQIMSGSAVENEWQQESIQPVGMEYTQPAAAATYPQTYTQPEAYAPEYTDYYTEIPKDPRGYHHTPEVDWERKSRGRSTEVERDRERDRDRERSRDVTYQKTGSLERDHGRVDDRRDRDRDRDRDREQRDRDRDRDRGYSRSHSRDRDRQATSRDRDWEHDRERDRAYKHQDGYRRRDDREERKRPRTPPPKRPHTPHGEHKEVPPPCEGVNEEDGVVKKPKNEKEEQEGEGVKESQSSPREEVAQIDVEEFEPILSDEDIVDDSEHYPEMDYDYSGYTNNDDLIKLFMPGVTELQSYSKKGSYVVEEDKIEVSDYLTNIIGIVDDFFKSSITRYTLETFERCNTEIKEEFIHLCEKVCGVFEDIKNFCDLMKIFENRSRLDKEIMNQSEFVVATLVDWLKIALNFDMANSQEQPGYKIRHIKCGIRLAEWCCNSVEFVKILWERDLMVHEILLDLYGREYMALSIKLMILRALDTYLLKKPAIECFLLGKPEKQNGFFDTLPFSERNGYATLVELLRKNPSVRLKFAINSILKKLNFFEILYKLESAVAKLRNENKDRILHNEMNLIIRSLDQILRTLQAGPFTVSQHKRFLPVSAQFEINRMDCRNVLIDFLEMFNVLQCFLLLLTLPVTMNISLVKNPIYEIISQLLSSPEGLKYLSKNCEVVNVLLKCLLQNEEEVQFLSENVENKSYQLGMTLAYSLQCFYHVERLTDIGEACKHDCNSSEVIDELHALFCLTFPNIGKFACARVLGIDDHVKCLLQFLDVLNGKEKLDSQISKLKKSPSVGYIVDLLLTIVVNEANVPFLEAYAKQLLGIVAQKDLFESSVSEKLNEMYPFLKPLENVSALSYDNISPYVELINKNLDNVTTYPGQLITSLRIIEHLGISIENSKDSLVPENPLNSYVELKYKHVILQLFSLDGVSLLTKVLQKICEHYEQPTLHSAIFASNQSITIVSLILPTIRLLKQMLKYVIQCRNMLFKDLTSVPVLLQTYTLVHSFPNTSPVYFKVQKICKEIVETLLVYTQPVSDEVHENDSLNKTLWTLMSGEVIKYIPSAPYTFIPGLLTLSELLPLPLPIQSQEDLTKEEISKAINLRKLWSAHLHPHSGAIQELINKMCLTSHQPLSNLLRRVCVQLSDLAANTAVMIARGVLDTVYNSLNANTDKIAPCGGNAARLLNFLACLVTHSPIKCAVLHLFHNYSNCKGDEKYAGIVTLFTSILKTNDVSNFHVQAQECILSMFQSFCDSEITLLQLSPDEKTELTSEVYLANALPMRDTFLCFINTMIDHLMADNCFITFLPIIRTMLLLTEHNYGFYHLCECLAKRTEPLSNLLKKLVQNFSKDNNECLSALNALTEFLRVCPSLDEADASLIHAPRSIKASIGEIKKWIGWKADEQNDLCVLEDLLKKVVQEDNTFDSLLEGLCGVIKCLSSNEVDEVKQSHTEPVLPPPESLLIQFSGRQVYSSVDTLDNRLTSNYWLSLPATDESDADIENIPCDLSELCKQYLPPEISLVREVEKLCRISSTHDAEQGENKEKRNDQQKDKMKRPFVTPMRGRGFPRAVPQRSDLFRSRPPNTSRPPSLHVDDFVALETCGAQPTGPTGYNKISRELLATTRLSRGTRGRAFVTSERAMQYRQMSWWSTGMTRSVYQ